METRRLGNWATGFAVLLASLLAACREPENTPRVASDTTRRANAYGQRIVIYLEAPVDSIMAGRDTASDEFAVIADDLLFYRASAYDFFEQRGLRVERIVGRRPLRFLVRGAVKQYDFRDVPFLDVIVLYEPGREPKAIAPVDVEEALRYFAEQPSTRQ